MTQVKSIYDILKESAQRVPDKAAYWYRGRKETYGNLLKRIHAFADALLTAGIRKGDTVMIMLSNCPQTVIALYAANLIGAAACTVHPGISSNELKQGVRQVRPRVMITDAEHEQNVSAVSAEDTILVVADMKDEGTEIPGEKTMAQKTGSADSGTAKRKRWEDLVKDSEGKPVPRSCAEPDGTALIVFSGGTSGRQKAVALTNRNLSALTDVLRKTLPVPEKEDGFLNLMPNFHLLGIACILFPVSYGIEMVLLPQFSAGSFRDSVAVSGCTFLVGTPSFYVSMMRLPNWRPGDMKNLKMAASAGEKLNDSVRADINRFLKDLGAAVPVQDAYGMTEVCLIAMEDRKAEEHNLITVCGAEILIADPITMSRQPEGTAGEILICNPLLQARYLHDEDNRKAAVEIGGKRYFRSGDAGFQDGAGNLHICGRIKRMIISGGYNVYPEHIENEISGLPYVTECFVAGAENDRGTQTVKAFVVLLRGGGHDRETYERQAKARIIRHCRNTLAEYEVPTEFAFVEGLPKTPAGKVAMQGLTGCSQKT